MSETKLGCDELVIWRDSKLASIEFTAASSVSGENAEVDATGAGLSKIHKDILQESQTFLVRKLNADYS